jgi:hypothetical protein
MPLPDDEAALLARFRALSTPSSLPVAAVDEASGKIDVTGDHHAEAEQEISDADVSEMSSVSVG